jgi:hypothetical protein
LAEGEGFEPPVSAKPTPLFESGTISLSVTPPGVIIIASEGARAGKED